MLCNCVYKLITGHQLGSTRACFFASAQPDARTPWLPATASTSNTARQALDGHALRAMLERLENKLSMRMKMWLCHVHTCPTVELQRRLMGGGPSLSGRVREVARTVSSRRRGRAAQGKPIPWGHSCQATWAAKMPDWQLIPMKCNVMNVSKCWNSGRTEICRFSGIAGRCPILLALGRPTP